MNINIDTLEDGAVIELLVQHHEEMYLYSPPESIHSLDTAQLQDPSITFWSAREGGVIAGCGGLKQLSESLAEIKAMKTEKCSTLNTKAP